MGDEPASPAHNLELLDIDPVDIEALKASDPTTDEAERRAAFDQCRGEFVAGFPAYDFDAWPARFDEPLFRAHVLIASVSKLLEFHRQRGVSEDVSRSTV